TTAKRRHVPELWQRDRGQVPACGTGGSKNGFKPSPRAHIVERPAERRSVVVREFESQFIHTSTWNNHIVDPALQHKLYEHEVTAHERTDRGEDGMLAKTGHGEDEANSSQRDLSQKDPSFVEPRFAKCLSNKKTIEHGRQGCAGQRAP